MKTKLFVAAMASLMVFASCVKDIESASVTNVRNAKAAELTSIAAYNNAMAEAAVITANAEAALKAAQAEYQKAQAELVKAQAELLKVQTEEERTRLELLIVELETAKARSAAELERIAREMELELEKHKLDLFKAQQAYIEYAQQLEEAERARLITVSAAYTQAVEDLIDLQVDKINAEAAIAALEAGLENQDKFIDAEIERALADIAFYDAEIANLEKYISADAAELAAALDKAALARQDAALAKNEAASAMVKAGGAETAAWTKVTEGKFEKGFEDVKDFASAYFGSIWVKDGVYGYKNEYGVFVPLYEPNYPGRVYITYKDQTTWVEDFTPAKIYGDNFKAAIDVKVETENAIHELSLKKNEENRTYYQSAVEKSTKTAEAAYPEAMQKEIKKAYDDATERLEAASVAADEAYLVYADAYKALGLNEENAVYIANKAHNKAQTDKNDCQTVINTKPSEIASIKADIVDEKENIARQTNLIENLYKPELVKIAAAVKENDGTLAAAEAKVAEFKLDEKKEKELSTRLDYYAHQSAEDAETYKKAWDDAVKALNDVLNDEGYKAAVAEVNGCKDEAERLKGQAEAYNGSIVVAQGNIQTSNEKISELTAQLEKATAEYNNALASIDALEAKVKEAKTALDEAIKAQGLAGSAIDVLWQKYDDAYNKYWEIYDERMDIAVVDYVNECVVTDVTCRTSNDDTYRYASGTVTWNSVEILLPGNNTWNDNARNAYKNYIYNISESTCRIEICDRFVEILNEVHEENITEFNDMKQFIDDCTSLEEGYLADIEAANTASDNYVTAWMAYVDADEVNQAADAEYAALLEVYAHDANINNKINEFLGYEQDLIDYVNGLIEAYNDDVLTLEILKAKLPIYDAQIAAQEKLVEALEAELNALLGE